jgi:FtsH-binding integral membrane protein
MFGTAYTGGMTYRSAEQINSAMGRVYGHMAVAVLISMFTSYQVSANAALMAFFFTGIMKWIVIFAPLLLILAFSVASEKFTKTGSQIFLYIFSALMGLSFATIFLVYNMGSIVSAFMGGAVLFGVMSGYGYFTRKDLSEFASLLLVGLIAIIIASVINIFVGSTVFQMVISAIAILVFLGLTAYDTQRIRQEVSVENNGIAEIRGALSLYLNFINLFLSLLQLFGEKKD